MEGPSLGACQYRGDVYATRGPVALIESQDDPHPYSEDHFRTSLGSFNFHLPAPYTGHSTYGCGPSGYTASSHSHNDTISRPRKHQYSTKENPSNLSTLFPPRSIHNLDNVSMQESRAQPLITRNETKGKQPDPDRIPSPQTQITTHATPPGCIDSNSPIRSSNGPHVASRAPKKRECTTPPFSPESSKFKNLHVDDRTAGDQSDTSSSSVLPRSGTAQELVPALNDSSNEKRLTSGGPLERTWNIAPSKRGRSKNTTNKASKKQKTMIGLPLPTTSRRPYEMGRRLEVAENRRNGVCTRCSANKVQCVPDPSNPHGECRTCQKSKFAGSIPSGLPCHRLKITEAELTKERPAPFPDWTDRWTGWEIRNITDWASSETIQVKLSHGFEAQDLGDPTYTLKLRRFIPRDTDQLYETWFDGSIQKFHWIPTYAIEDMHDAAKELEHYVNRVMAASIATLLGNHKTTDSMIWDTFLMAFKQIEMAQDTDEQILIHDVILLWVTSRMMSMPEKFCEGTTLGERVQDRSSPYLGIFPIPPVIYAQLEIITFSRVQRPIRDRVRDRLEKMLKDPRRSQWFTIYLAIYILSHSCALISGRNEEYARQMGLPTLFATPKSIADLHRGIRLILIEYHIRTKNNPLIQPMSSNIHPQLQSDGMSLEQIKFIVQTQNWVDDNRRRFQDIRQARDFSNPLYFISRLYDSKWEEMPIAEEDLRYERVQEING